MRRHSAPLSFFAALLAGVVSQAVPVPFAPVPGEADSSRPLAPFGRVETDDSGAETLVVDTMRGGVWNAAFRTADSLFEPGKAYEISFRCAIEEQTDEAYILLLMRPADAPNHQRDAANLEVYATPKGDGIVRFRVKIPAVGDKSRQAFQIHTFKGLRARISSLQVRELVRASFPVDRPYDASPAAPRPDPTGCPAFTVDLPAPAKNVYRAAEHGVSPDNPDNSEAFQALLWTARKNRPAKIVLDKGVYRFGDGADLLMDTTFDVEIDGQNSTFLFRKTKGKLFSIYHSERVAVRNLVVDWDWDADPLASRVDVVAKSDDGRSVDLRFVDCAEFPRRDVRVADLSERDPATDFMPPGGGVHVGFEFFKGRGAPEAVEWVAPNVLRVRSSVAQLERVRPGMRFLMRHYVYDMNAFQLISDRHLTFDNVHVRSCPGMGFLASGTQECWQILHSSVHQAPGSNRPVAATADAIHAGSSRGRIRIEDTVLGGGGDDTLNLHDGSVYALRLDDHRVLTLNHNNLPGNYFWKGHPVEFRDEDFSPAGFTGHLTEVRRVNPGRGQVELVFEETLPEPAGRGFILFNRNYGTRDVLVRGCTFDRFPRGILLMADNATVEDCVFQLGLAGGIKIESGYTMKVWSEGYGASNVVVRGNVFRQANTMGRYDYEGRPDIYVSSYRVVDPSMDKTRYPLFRDILIENNSFSGTTGAPVYLASAGDVTIRGNAFDLTSPSPAAEATRGGIVLDSVTGVSILDNTWTVPSDGSVRPAVHYEADTVTGLRASGNRVLARPAAAR